MLTEEQLIAGHYLYKWLWLAGRYIASPTLIYPSPETSIVSCMETQYGARGTLPQMITREDKTALLVPAGGAAIVTLGNSGKIVHLEINNYRNSP